MKRSLFIAAVLGVAIAAAVTAAPFRIAVVMPSATTDMAFSQSMWSALQAIQKQMGGASALDLKFSENMYNVPDAAAAVRDYASQGFDIVIATDRSTAPPCRRSRRTFPT